MMPKPFDDFHTIVDEETAKATNAFIANGKEGLRAAMFEALSRCALWRIEQDRNAARNNKPF